MQQQQQRKQSTRNYDAVAKKIRKLLSATGQTFIPELCEALAKDWYPQLSKDQIKSNKQVRDEIRDKILLDWSKDLRVLSDNIWSDQTIIQNFPDWLRNPTQQDSTEQTLQLAREARQAKINQKRLISERERQKLDQVATNLPDNVIIPEPREQVEPVSDEELTDLGLASYGSSDRTMHSIRNGIHEHARRLFAELCDGKEIPFADEDLIVDFIKPTREYRSTIAYELDKPQRAHLHNVMVAVSEACQDMIDQIDKADR